MPPRTRSRTSPPVLSTQPDAVVIHPDSESELSSEGEQEEEDEDSPLITSPSSLTYNLSHLSARRQAHIRETFSDPPQIALQQCAKLDGTFAFQMTELVTRSIRIRDNDGVPRLACSCQNDREDNDNDEEAEKGEGGSCPHLIWLLDKMVSQMLYGHAGDVLSMNERGYADELGDPYAAISNHHLDILAAGLHCRIMDSSNSIDATRDLEARELISSVYDRQTEDFQPILPGTTTKPARLIRRNDLEQTIFNMLADNSHFFSYFLSHTRLRDDINDPFRKIRQRIDLVLRSLNDPDDESSTSDWAATHILGCVSRIRSSIYTQSKPLSARAASSATSTLIHILTATIDRPSLYHYLIGDKDTGFVISTLELLPQAGSPFLCDLEDLLERVSLLGCPASYVDKFRALCSRLRRARAGSGAKRYRDDESEGRAKRRA